MGENGDLVIKKSGGVVFDGEKFFVVKRNKYNDISLPKGHIDSGENAEQAALREVLEETGLDCEIVGDLGIVEYKNFEGNVQVQYYVMLVKQVETEKLFPDVDEVVVGNYEEVRNLLSYTTDRDMLKKGFEFFESHNSENL